LKAEDVSALVLPPLAGVPENELAEVRRLHGEGVHLLCSEDAASLSDLFDAGRAEVILRDKDGNPLLTVKKTASGLAVFFTNAPSMMKRGRDCVGGSGQEALDERVNRAAADIMRCIGNYPVTATCGSVTAFESEDGHGYAFVRENSWPQKGHRIRPEVFFRGKCIANLELDEHASEVVELY
jgi:hypothetical protein